MFNQPVMMYRSLTKLPPHLLLSFPLSRRATQGESYCFAYSIADWSKFKLFINFGKSYFFLFYDTQFIKKKNKFLHPVIKFNINIKKITFDIFGETFF